MGAVELSGGSPALMTGKREDMRTDGIATLQEKRSPSSTPVSIIGETRKPMRYSVKCALGMATLLLSTMAQAQPPGGGVIMPGVAGESMRLPRTIGINEDVQFTIDPVCGVVIIVHSPTMPYSSYTGLRNPWGAPAPVSSRSPSPPAPVAPRRVPREGAPA